MHSKILLVDDIFDTGRSVKATIEAIKEGSKLSKPCEIKVATVFYKPEKNLEKFIKDSEVYKIMISLEQKVFLDLLIMLWVCIL